MQKHVTGPFDLFNKFALKTRMQHSWKYEYGYKRKKKNQNIFHSSVKIKTKNSREKISFWNIFYTTTYRYLNVQKCKFQRKLKSKQFHESMHLYNYFAWLTSAIFLNYLVAVNVKFTRLHYHDAHCIRSRMSVEWLEFFLRTIGNDCNCSSVKLSSV